MDGRPNLLWSTNGFHLNATERRICIIREREREPTVPHVK